MSQQYTWSHIKSHLGMFTVMKVRDDLAKGDYADPGCYKNSKGTVARRVSSNPNFGKLARRKK